MATKGELEWQCNTFQAIATQAIEAQQNHLYSQAIDYALQSFPFIDGMIQYERRYKKTEQINQPTLKLILAFSPVIFRWHSIDQVEVLINTTKRIERNSDIEWRSKIDESRKLLISAQNLWNSIETLQHDFSTIDPISRSFILTAWERIGLVSIVKDSKTFQYQFVSALNARYRAKCPECGQICDATKESLLSKLKCPRCMVTSYFVLLEPVFRKGD